MSVLAISACANPYYGYTKKEWDKLSEQQRQTAKKEFAEMQKKKKDLEHDQLLRERDEQIIRRGLGEPY
jgi:mRNA-degrading endonuclease RelE of RelBE toxin-antitoxin system